MDIHVRKAMVNDLTAMTAIYNSVIEEGGFTADLDIYTHDERHKWFNDHNNESHGIYVLESQKEVVGYFYFSPWRSGRSALAGVREISFYIHKHVRGRGLGDLILEQAIDIAVNRGFTHLIAILLDINEPSRKLLKKWEFEPAGKLVDIAKLKNETCGQLIMLRTLKYK